MTSPIQPFPLIIPFSHGLNEKMVALVAHGYRRTRRFLFLSNFFNSFSTGRNKSAVLLRFRGLMGGAMADFLYVGIAIDWQKPERRKPLISLTQEDFIPLWGHGKRKKAQMFWNNCLLACQRQNVTHLHDVLGVFKASMLFSICLFHHNITKNRAAIHS